MMVKHVQEGYLLIQDQEHKYANTYNRGQINYKECKYI